jgi:hypothetical protein
MSKGILLFAFNNGTTDYFKMAVSTASRAYKFLNLRTTVVTDSNTIVENYFHTFENVIVVDSDNSNRNVNKEIWINKGRYQAYDLSPYDETLLLDTDYLINSDTLLKPFELYDDFMCHNTTEFLMKPNEGQEKISKYSFNTLWATVIYFKKTKKTKLIFDTMKMVQENYQHYINIYNPVVGFFRNDYALTFALRIVNGQTEDVSNYIPWPLTHADKDVTVVATKHQSCNESYDIYFNQSTTYGLKKQFITIKDKDFHMINKENFMEIV